MGGAFTYDETSLTGKPLAVGMFVYQAHATVQGQCMGKITAVDGEAFLPGPSYSLPVIRICPSVMGKCPLYTMFLSVPPVRTCTLGGLSMVA